MIYPNYYIFKTQGYGYIKKNKYKTDLNKLLSGMSFINASVTNFKENSLIKKHLLTSKCCSFLSCIILASFSKRSFSLWTSSFKLSSLVSTFCSCSVRHCTERCCSDTTPRNCCSSVIWEGVGGADLSCSTVSDN